jgi:putative membrane protein
MRGDIGCKRWGTIAAAVLAIGITASAQTPAAPAPDSPPSQQTPTPPTPAQEPAAPSQQPPSPRSPSTPPTPAELPAAPQPAVTPDGSVLPEDQLGPSPLTDRDFAKDAATTAMMDIALGKQALEKADSGKLKAFAKKVVAEHERVYGELKRLAALSNIPLPAEIDPVHQDTIDRLGGLSGEAFDRAYALEMSREHESIVGAFKYQSERGTDAGLKEFAVKELPTLEEHLKEIDEIRKDMIDS